MSDLLTVPEVAEVFRTSRQSVYRWIKKGSITALKTPGGTLRIRRADVEAAMSEGVLEPENTSSVAAAPDHAAVATDSQPENAA